MPELENIPEIPTAGSEQRPVVPSSFQPRAVFPSIGFLLATACVCLLLIGIYRTYVFSQLPLEYTTPPPPVSMPTPTHVEPSQTPTTRTQQLEYSVPTIVQLRPSSAAPSHPPSKPSPTPIVLHAGVGQYTVSHPKSSGPTISTVIFSPLDVRKGQSLTLSVAMQSSSAIGSVIGLLETDTTKKPLTFTKVTPVITGGQTWSTSLTVPDTLWYTYIVTINATNTQGTTSVTVAPRS